MKYIIEAYYWVRSWFVGESPDASEPEDSAFVAQFEREVHDAFQRAHDTKVLTGTKTQAI